MTRYFRAISDACVILKLDLAKVQELIALNKVSISRPPGYFLVKGEYKQSA